MVQTREMKGIIFHLVLAVAVHGSTAQRFRPCQDSHPCLCSTSKHTMTCKGADLTQVPVTTFNRKVVHLSLCDNRIASVSSEAFSTYPNLRSLYLSNSGIYTIHKYAFKNLPALEELDLSFNPLNQLHPDTFVENTALHTLVLEGNTFMRLPADGPVLASAFLTKLDLSLCGIDKLSPEAFAGLPNLRRLNLASNKLVALATATLRPLKLLEELKVDGNEWKCDCHLHELLSWTGMLRGQQVQYRDTRCIAENGRDLVPWSYEEQGRRCAAEMEDRRDEDAPTTSGKTGPTQAPSNNEEREPVYSSTSKGVPVNNQGLLSKKQTDVLESKITNIIDTEIISPNDTDFKDEAGMEAKEIKMVDKANPEVNNHADDSQHDHFCPCNLATEQEKQDEIRNKQLTLVTSSIFQIVFIIALVCMTIAIIILTGLLIKYAFAAGHNAYMHIRLNSQDSNHYESPYHS